MRGALQFYPFSYPLHAFPSLAAALLKYKKHEWVLVAFEKDKQVGLVWENKGPDNTQVPLYLPSDQVQMTARREASTSVLVFHNHPNPDPYHFDALRPSDQDHKSATQMASFLNPCGVNVLEFVCERGRFIEYFRSPADGFLPLSGFALAVSHVNGRRKLTNLRLHVERIF